MKNMQRGFLKFVGPIFLLAVSFQSSFAQISTHRLKTADSLFAAKLYTQSFEHYEQILNQKEYTPAMLLKMAYIQEGLNHIGRALYYLNLYYLATKDKTTLDKIQELASKYNLEGYDVSETDRLMSFYHHNRIYVSLGIVALMILLLSAGIYGKKRGTRPVASFALLILFGCVFFVHLYYGEEVSTGIVANPSTYIMKGPSGAASVVEIIGDGHRMEVVGHHDVWLKVRWEGEICYVKENALLPLEL
jgi:hypothetical protein